MRIKILIIASVIFSSNAISQVSGYNDSLITFRNNYVETHGAVKPEERNKLNFFAINESFKAKAKFEKIYQSSWFTMEASGTIKQSYRAVGSLRFTINNASYLLYVYQSQSLMTIAEYTDYLFVPFTDFTNGIETYESGRYVDLTTKEIVNGYYQLDFNKAYNPYCAYITGVYSCPIPPKENNLKVAIMAGEMKFQKNNL